MVARSGLVGCDCLPEQVGVGAGTNEIQIVAIDFVDKESIRFDVGVSKLPPLAAEQMVFVARG